jgi:hypothetical protein
MDTKKELEKIWETYKNSFESKTELKEILNRGFAYSKSVSGDVLIVGFNPSCRKREDEQKFIGFNFCEVKEKDPYFKSLWNIVNVKDENVRYGYIDLFNYRGTVQDKTLKKIFDDKHGCEFLVKQLELNQKQIEEAKPKLILVFNKGAYNFWGINAEPKNDPSTNVWMEYTFEDVEGYNGKLLNIIGLLNSNERISKEIKETNLKGTRIYFSKYTRWLKKEERENISNEIKSIIRTYILKD